MYGNMVCFIALNFILRIFFAGMMRIAFVVKIFFVHFHNSTGHMARFWIPGDMVADLKFLFQDLQRLIIVNAAIILPVYS